MAHASESGHFYHRDGTPCYEVPRADGKGMRPATLKDARKLGLYPGVTSIIKCADKPALNRWMQQQVLMAALTLPRIDGETSEQLCARILADSGEQARKARDKGTEIHAAIQGHYEGKAPSEEMWPYVTGAIKVIEACFGRRDWLTEIACANPMGYGTKADLHDSGLGGLASGVVLDFKGSEFDEAKAPTLKTWDEHHMQLAATRMALDLPGAECAIVYVSRNVPGLCRLIRVDDAELEQGWSMFRALLDFWQTKNGYHPQKWKAAA